MPAKHDAIAHEFAAIRHELAGISMAIRQKPNYLAPCDARYLSDAEAVHYYTASRHLSNSQETIRFCEQHFDWLIQRGLQEELHVLTLNGAHCVIRSHQVTVGLLNSSPVHAREVFRPAILDAAASVVLVHNHPSGNPKPSAEDLKVTECLEAAGKVVGIKVLDHIVVAREGCTSIIEFRERQSLIG